MNGTERERHHARRIRRVGTVAIVAALLAVVAIFARGSIFKESYEIRAVVRSGNGLQTGSEVRIAGVRSGEVRAVEPGEDGTAVITMRIDEDARPIGSDATLSIEPRLILEGNFYVRMEIGQPNVSELADGGTIPIERTANPVQLDQVLNVFDLPTRNSMHRAIAELERGLGGPEAATGSGALRQAWLELERALPSTAITARAFRGTEPGDLPRLVTNAHDFTAQLSADPRALADIVTNFDRVMGSLSQQDRRLAETLQGVDSLLDAAPAGLDAVDAALPELTEAGRLLRPSLDVAPEALQAATGTVEQLAGLSQPAEAPRLLTLLEPISTTLPGLEGRLQELAPFVTSASRCLSDRVVPVLTSELEDGPNSTGDPVYLDMMHSFAASTGSAPTFDGNGVSVRAGVATGEGAATTYVLPESGGLVGGGPEIQGVRPTWLGAGVEPQYRPDAPCIDQPLPDLTLRSGGPPDWQQTQQP